MPALDGYHQAVRNALIKDGWTITDDPLTLRVGPDRIPIDLGAERLLVAEKGARRIADLEEALGQYVVYRMALRRTEPDRELYLAVPEALVVNEFQRRAL